MPPSTSKSHILIVDDDTSLRETLAELLEMAGFYPIKAASAAEALGILRQEQRVDAMVTDLAMPDVDGVALIRQALKIRDKLPVLLLTGYAGVTNSTTIDHSSFHILHKPVQSQRLIAKLESLVGQKADPE